MQITQILKDLENNNNLRTFKKLKHDGLYVYKDNKRLLNLSSNDYLNLSTNNLLKEEFLDIIDKEYLLFSSASSRSLSGNFGIYNKLESYIESLFDNKQALLFNSGYHLNISCIQALSSLDSILFIVDKLVHASIIDGLRLGGKRFLRYKHNCIQHLKELLEKHYNNYENIIIITEGLFSMDGDYAKIQEICNLKNQYKNILIYLDEAHSIGAFGDKGLGLANTLKCDKDIDFLIFTFGKAIGSVGASILCKAEYKNFFINKARGLIYSTALPPINIAWSLFVFNKIINMQDKREKLFKLSYFLRDKLQNIGKDILGESYIISILAYSNENAILLMDKLEQYGFFAPAIKSPSVAKNTERIRISLTSDMQEDMLYKLVEIL